MFDAYAQFEESMISAKMETTAEMGATEEGTLSFISSKLFNLRWLSSALRNRWLGTGQKV